MITLSQLKAIDFGYLIRASDVATRRADGVAGRIEEARRRMDEAKTWTGKVHDAAVPQLEYELELARDVRSLLYRLADEARDSERELSSLRSDICAFAGDVAKTMTVDDDGTCHASDSDDESQATQLSGELKTLMQSFDAADQRFVQELRMLADHAAQITAGDNTVRIVSDCFDVHTLAASLQQQSPKDIASTFASLSRSDAVRVAEANPALIGNLNGVPFDIRAVANDINIRAALAEELRRPQRNEARITQLQAMLKPIEPQGRVTGRGITLDRKFVSFRPDQGGRAIEMIGTLDRKTKGVGVLVPGTTANLDGSASDHKHAVDLANKSGAPVFLYLDGQFPQDLNEAAKPVYAANMAKPLVDFSTELHREVATHAPAAKTTFIGHSYGGSIVGTAEAHGLVADRVVHASSAGTGIDNAYDHRNPNIRHYSMTAPGDPIQAVQEAGEIPITILSSPGYPLLKHLPFSPWWDFDQLVGSHVPNLSPHGRDPDSAPGFTNLPPGFYSDHSPSHPGERISGRDGHSQYWNDPDSTAFKNLAAVVNGQADQGHVVVDPRDQRLSPRGFGRGFGTPLGR